jgi:hypothetical protein
MLQITHTSQINVLTVSLKLQLARKYLPKLTYTCHYISEKKCMSICVGQSKRERFLGKKCERVPVGPTYWPLAPNPFDSEILTDLIELAAPTLMTVINQVEIIVISNPKPHPTLLHAWNPTEIGFNSSLYTYLWYLTG